MDRPRYLLPAGANFTGDQDRHIHFGRFLDTPEQGLHRRAAADQAILGLGLALLAQISLGQFGHAVGMTQRDRQTLGING